MNEQQRTAVTKEQMEDLIIAEFYFRGDEAVLETAGAFGEYVGTVGGRIEYHTAVEQDAVMPETQEQIEQQLSLMTFCIIVFKNGFKIDGMSACVDPARYSVAIGRQLARENALNKIWPILGYELATQLNGDIRE